VDGKLRIYFTNEDLARTRFAAEPDPLWELVISTYKIGTTRGGIVHDHWRRTVKNASPSRRTGVGLIRDLVPSRGAFPDFLTPLAGQSGLDAGLDAFMHTPAAQVDAELEFIARERSLPAWTRDLATGSSTRRELAQALRAYHDTFLAPYWPTVKAHVDADRAVRARAFLDGGCEGVLASLRPFARWRRPVLETPYPVDRDVHLAGRGLTLIPSYFCWYNPVTLLDRSCPAPVLVYPVDHDLTLTATTAVAARSSEQRLASLVGRTRGQILTALANTYSTGEIACRFGLSAATVSVHTTTLREAGLITTRRNGSGALHIRSPLGNSVCRSCGIT
jgi:DNA-binding transcriptional ArsR family regulator